MARAPVVKDGRAIATAASQQRRPHDRVVPKVIQLYTFTAVDVIISGAGGAVAVACTNRRPDDYVRSVEGVTRKISHHVKTASF